MNHNPGARLQRLLEHLDGAYAPNTLRAYRADMLEFIAYCEAKKERALPASPQTVAGFLLQTLNLKLKTASIRRKAYSISAIHRLTDHPDPTKHSEVRIAIRKICRQLGTRFDQAYPINKRLLEKLLSACGNDLRGKRNRALLMLAYDSMRRRSELTALRVEDIDWFERGASILLRKSKTDQVGAGQWVHVGKRTATMLQVWIKAAKLTDGFLLRGVKGVGHVTPSLTGHQLSRILKSIAQSAGLGLEVVGSISGHSIRIGGAQDLMIQGASMPQIMVKGGWAKTDTVIRYIERVRPEVNRLLIA